MTEEEIIRIAHRIALEEYLDIPKDKHSKHHEFLEYLWEEYRERKARREKVKAQVIGWAVISILSGIGWLGYMIAMHFWNLAHHNPGGP